VRNAHTQNWPKMAGKPVSCSNNNWRVAKVHGFHGWKIGGKAEDVA